MGANALTVFAIASTVKALARAMKDAYFRFRLSNELLEQLHERTENVSGYLRDLVRRDISERPGTIDSAPKSPYLYHAELEEVIDGDTLRLNVDLGFEISQGMIVRLAGVNSPEVKTKKGKLARDFAAKQLKNANLIVETRKREKFGRYLAVIHYHKRFTDYSDIMEHGKVLNDELLTSGLARRYNI